MYIDLSHFFLIVIPFTFLLLKYERIHWISSILYIVTSAAFLGIVVGYVCSDFSFFMTFSNSNQNTPLFYKISATWSNHEGSLLLWCWLLGVYAFIFLSTEIMPKGVSSSNIDDGYFKQLSYSKFGVSKNVISGCLPQTKRFGVFFFKKPKITHQNGFKFLRNFFLTKRLFFLGEIFEQSKKSFLEKTKWVLHFVLRIFCLNNHGWAWLSLTHYIYICIFVWFISFLLWTSNPYLKMPFVCLNSITELNPVLQDPVLAIHPPCIYAGYVASAIVFSVCVSFCFNAVAVTFFRVAEKKNTFLKFFLTTTRDGIFMQKKNNVSKFFLNKGKLFCLENSTCCKQKLDLGCSFSKQNSFAPVVVPQLDLLSDKSVFVLKDCFKKNTQKQLIFLEKTHTKWKLKFKSLQFFQKRLLCPKASRVVSLGHNYYHFFKINGFQTFFRKTNSNCNSQHNYQFLKTTYIFAQIRIWMLTCWCLVTVGILLGSWWAYHELGWGGWWFWDPVENASLMPWLLATASIHSVKGTLLFKQKRTLHFSKPIFEMGSNQNPENQLLLWTLFLSIWTFLFSILGTFFVRSGVLTSVHSFATDSTRGLCLLFFFGWMCFVSHFFLTLLKTIIFKANFFFPFFGFIVLAKGLPFCMPKRFGAGHKTKTQTYPKHTTRLAFGYWLKQLAKQFFFFKVLWKKKEILQKKTPLVLKKVSSQLQKKSFFSQLILIQNWLLALICIIVLCGTVTPILFQWLLNRDVYTGALFFNTTTIPLWSCALFLLLYQHYMHLMQQCVYSKLQVKILISFSCALLMIHVCCFQNKSNRFGLLDSVYITLSLLIVYCLIILTKKLFFSFIFKHQVCQNKNPNLLGIQKGKPFAKTMRPKNKSGVFLKKTNFEVSRLCGTFFVSPFLFKVLTPTTTANKNPADHSMVLAHVGVIILLLGIIMSYRYKTQSTKSIVFGQMINLPPININTDWVPQNAFWVPFLKIFVPQTKRLKQLAENSNQKINTFKNEIGWEKSLDFFKQVENNFVRTPLKKSQLFQTKQNSNQFLFEPWESTFCLNKINLHLFNCSPSRIFCLRSIDKNYGPTFQSICGNFIIYEIKPFIKVFTQNTLSSAPVVVPQLDLLSGTNCLNQKVWGQNCVPKTSCPTKKGAETVFFSNTLCLFPEKRFITNKSSSSFVRETGANGVNSSISKVAIHTNWFLDVYTLVGSGNVDGGWYTTIMQLPFMSCIWMGFVFGIYGGVNALRVCLKKHILPWQ